MNLNRILLVAYLILAALILVVVAALRGQIGPGEAQAMAVLLVVLVVADVLLQRLARR